MSPRFPNPRNLLSALAGGRGGNVAVSAAMLLPIAVALAAIAVDSGSIYLERRRAQNIADLTAIAVASDMRNAEKVARAMAEKNGYDNVRVYLADWKKLASLPAVDPRVVSGPFVDVLVEEGRYTANPVVGPAHRFAKGPATPNAVRVSIRTEGALFFGASLVEKADIEAEGTALIQSQAAATVGSRLASLNGGIGNAVLNGLLGTSVSLNVMDYRALLAADIELFGFMDMLARDIRLKAATYDELLATNLSLAQLASTASRASPDAGARRALDLIAADPVAKLTKLRLDAVINLGKQGRLPIGRASGVVSVSASVLDMINAAVGAATGDRQVSLDFGASVPVVTDLTAELAIGERPRGVYWLAIGEAGQITRTAQTRLLLQAEVGGSGLLAGIRIRLPLYLEVAYAEARISQVNCHAKGWQNPEITVQVRPGVAEAWIGNVTAADMADFSRHPVDGSAVIVSTPALRVQASAHVDAGNANWKSLVFGKKDISDGNLKSVATTQILQSVVSSLLDDTSLSVNLLGLKLLSTSAVDVTLRNTLEQLAAPLDSVTSELLAALGVRVGEADVRANGYACNQAVLVQ